MTLFMELFALGLTKPHYRMIERMRSMDLLIS